MGGAVRGAPGFHWLPLQGAGRLRSLQLEPNMATRWCEPQDSQSALGQWPSGSLKSKRGRLERMFLSCCSCSSSLFDVIFGSLMYYGVGEFCLVLFLMPPPFKLVIWLCRTSLGSTS